MARIQHLLSTSHLAGTVLQVSFQKGGLNFQHYGISDGCGGVISNSKQEGKVVLETESKFSGGNPGSITVNSEIRGGGIRAYERAVSYLDKPYKLLSSNCEHFVRSMHDMSDESKQVQGYVIAAGLTMLGHKIAVSPKGGSLASYFFWGVVGIGVLSLSKSE